MKHKKKTSKKRKINQRKTIKNQPLRKVTSVHKDVSERLRKINPSLAKEVREILDENKSQRHIRGGMATKIKYLHMKEL
ncbi:MAG: sporulation transcriptional regulator SpoIIID [Clostridia bacterium]|nr:sporulation transcriptional regulator SpoIIID [Clostridia bacterium]